MDLEERDKWKRNKTMTINKRLKDVDMGVTLQRFVYT